MVKKSGQSAELNSDHSDMDPSLGAGDCAFIVSDQAAVVHQPTESTFDDPAPRQHFKATHIIGAFYHLDGQLGAQGLDLVGEGIARVTAIDPEQAEPRKPTQHPAQDGLASGALGGISRRDDHAQDQAQGIHEQMALAAFDALASVETHRAAMTGGLDALAVQYRGRGLAALALSPPNQDPQGIIEGRPKMTALPAPEDTIDGLPGRKISGQIPPLDAPFDDIEDGVNHWPQIGTGTAPFGGFRQHGSEIFPLVVGEARSVFGVFHRPNGSFRLKVAAPNQSQCQ